MVDFTYQFDWAMKCPDTWLNIILELSVRAVLEEIGVWIDGLSKTSGLPQRHRHHPARWGPKEGGICPLSTWLLRWGSNVLLPSVPWSSSLQTWTIIYSINSLNDTYLQHSWVSGLQMEDHGTLSLQNCMSQNLIINLFYIRIYILLVLLLWRILVNTRW